MDHIPRATVGFRRWGNVRDGSLVHWGNVRDGSLVLASSDSFEVRGMYSCCFLFWFSILVNLKILEDWEQVIYLTGTHRKRL